METYQQLVHLKEITEVLIQQVVDQVIVVAAAVELELSEEMGVVVTLLDQEELV